MPTKEEYIKAAKSAEKILKEMHDLDPEMKKILFSKILDTELNREINTEKQEKSTASITIRDLPDTDSQDMTLQQWCLWILSEEFNKGNQWISPDEMFKILRDRHRIQTNVWSLSARLGELTRKGLVMRERKGKAFKYGISRKGKDYILQIKAKKR
ncbi:MAG: hypothetical protein HY517_03060 [Candidatus Aenigmarchaeota archaeon]|nr:hypothetical protein [Candidatus Aenigmarchaeota archaeon]